MSPDVEAGARNAPKFHTDRSAYGDALRRWFEMRHPEASGVRVTDIAIPVNTGFSYETVFVDMDWEVEGRLHHERFVVRLEPTDGALFPAQSTAAAVAVCAQHDVMAAVAAASDVPVPPTLGYEADASYFGRPFIVMGHVPGVVPPDTPRYSVAGFVVDEATPEQRERMVRNGLTAMAGIHRIDWRTAGLEWLDASGTGAPSASEQIDLYEAFAHDVLAGRRHPTLDAAFSWLRANDPRDERIGLTWGDARLGNIIWQDYEVAAVVDWEACALAPTEADVGWWLLFDRLSFDDLGVDRLAGFPTRDDMVTMYEDVSGREIRDAHYWEVFAATRLCTIFVRIADRLVATGFVSADENKAVVNSSTDALARLLADGLERHSAV